MTQTTDNSYIPEECNTPGADDCPGPVPRFDYGNGTLVTLAQWEAIGKLKLNWAMVDPPEPFIGGDCVMVYTGSVWIGIEADGYAHS